MKIRESNKLVFELKNIGLVVLVAFLAIGTVSCIVAPEECPYQTDTDIATMVQMIEAEAQAANYKDMSIIKDIFAPDAHIINEKDGTEWNDPVSHYTELFETFDFTNATNFDIKPFGKGITEDTAYICSANSGTYVMNGGDPEEYSNVEEKDTWIFKKNEEGCWVITEYRYH